MHAGDAFFHRQDVTPHKTAPFGFRAAEWVLAMDRAQLTRNHADLRRVAHTEGVVVICSHDRHMFEAAESGQLLAGPG